MSMLLNRRFWNPVLALSGGLVLVSGLFLFFHFKSHVIAGIHEWVSLVFIVACAVHLVLNSKPLIKSLGGRAVAWTMLAVMLLSGLGMTFSDMKKHEHNHTHQQKNMRGHGAHARHLH